MIAPLTPTTKPISFWWDDEAFHIGEKAYDWKSLKVAPRNGATFKLPLGVIDRGSPFLTERASSLSRGGPP